MLKNIIEFESWAEMSRSADLAVFMLFYKQTATCLHGRDARLGAYVHGNHCICRVWGLTASETSIFVEREIPAPDRPPCCCQYGLRSKAPLAY